MRVEYLLIVDSESSYLGTFNSVMNSLKIIHKVNHLNTSTFMYKGVEIEWSIEYINNKARIIDITFTLGMDEKEDKIILFEEFLTFYKKCVVKFCINEKIEVVWNDLGVFFTNKAYPKINYIENRMRYLISKFMFFQESYDWSQTRVSKKIVESNIHNKEKEINLLYSIDFIKLSDFLFNNYAVSDASKLSNKLKSKKKGDSISIEELDDFMQDSNWNRYFKQYSDIDEKKIVKTWNEIYQYRCAVAHNRELVSKEYKIICSKVDYIDQIIEKLLGELPKIKLSKEELATVSKNTVPDFIVIDTDRFNLISHHKLVDINSVKNIHPVLFKKLNDAKETFEKEGFITSSMNHTFNYLSNIQFSVFKRRDSVSYFYYGDFKGVHTSEQYCSFFGLPNGEELTITEENVEFLDFAEALISRFDGQI